MGYIVWATLREMRQNNGSQEMERDLGHPVIPIFSPGPFMVLNYGMPKSWWISELFSLYENVQRKAVKCEALAWGRSSKLSLDGKQQELTSLHEFSVSHLLVEWWLWLNERPNSLALTSHLTGFGSEARCCIHGTGINDRLGSTWKTVPYCIDMNPADKYKQLRYDCMNWVSSFRKKRKIIPKAASAVHLDLGRYWDSSAVHALVVTRERKIFCAKVLERTSIITKSERAWVDITQSEISIVSFANESVQPIGHKHFSWDWLEIWASW